MRGIDERDLRADEALDGLFEQWIMRAAEHERVDLGAHQIIEITANDLVGYGVVEPAILDERDENGTRLAGDPDLRVDGADRGLVGARVNGGPCPDDADMAFFFVAATAALAPGSDDTDDGHFQILLQPRDGQRGGGVARDDDDLGPLREEQPGDLGGIPLDGLLALAAIGHARRIADVKDILRRYRRAQRLPQP